MFDKINEDTFKKVKNRLDLALSEKQKQEIIEKLKNTDRSALLKMLEKIDLSKVSDERVESILNSMDAGEIVDKIKKM